jgi:hypothetical protein
MFGKILKALERFLQELPDEFRHLIQQFESESNTQQAPRTQPSSLQAKHTADDLTKPTLEENACSFSALHNRTAAGAEAGTGHAKTRPAQETLKAAPRKKRKVETDSRSCLSVEDIERWTLSPDDFFATKGPGSEEGFEICRYVSQVEKSQSLGAMQIRFALRSLYLSKVSWKGFKVCNFRKKLAGNGATVAASTLRAWVKEGFFYDLLCRTFGLHILFFDIGDRRE